MKNQLFLATCLVSLTFLPAWAQPVQVHGPIPPDAIGARGDPLSFLPPIDVLDKNGDGKVTQDEFNAALSIFIRKQFDLGDANGDGAISKEELQDANGFFPNEGLRKGPDFARPPVGPPPPEPPMAHQQEIGGRKSPMPPQDAPVPPFLSLLPPHILDCNGDGNITQEEFNAAMGEVLLDQFQKMDANQDRAISREELDRARGPHSAKIPEPADHRDESASNIQQR